MRYAVLLGGVLALVSTANRAPAPGFTVRMADAAYVQMDVIPDGGVSGAVVLSTDNPDSCQCSVGLPTCVIPNPDGGILPIVAPTGVTLRNATGLGCTSKPCAALWVGDSGTDETWPGDAFCPRPASM